MAMSFSTEPDRASGISGKVLLAAAAAVLAVVAIVAIATLRRAPGNTGAELPLDAYAAQLPIGGISLSEATNGGGGRVTYVDGKVQNSGTQTLTAATVQVTFNTNGGSAPQREAVPLTLIRTRQPYVDIEPVSAEPIRPGESREFRLIFETVPAHWNTEQLPDVRLVHAVLR